MIKIIFATLLTASPIMAEGQSIRFTEDPLVEANVGFHAAVERLKITVIDTECQVTISYPNGNLPINMIDGTEYQLIAIDGKEESFEEVILTAKSICWPTS